MITPPPHVVQRKRSSPTRRTAGTLSSAGRNAANWGQRPATAPTVGLPAGTGPTRRPITRPHIRQRRSAWTQSFRPAIAKCRFPFRATPTAPTRGDQPASCQYIRTARPFRFPDEASQPGGVAADDRLEPGLASESVDGAGGLGRWREVLVAEDREPVRGDHALRVRERDSAAAYLALQMCLHGVLLVRVGIASPRLGPEVGHVGGRAAQLQRDQVVELIAARRLAL